MNERSKRSYRKKVAATGRTVRERMVAPAGMKRCPDCKTDKLIEDYPRYARAADGRGTYCKPCHNQRGRHTKERQGGAREYHLRRRYGITGAEYDALVEAQGGVCALCWTRAPEHVDHDHVTGAVRGVLCSCCNQGLGNFRDSTATMRNAIDYLERTTWQRQQVCPGVYRLTSPRQAAARSRSSSQLQRLISSRRG